MTMLDYAKRPPGRLRWLANVTLAYPALTLVLYYAEFSCAWLALGHRPVANVDDPKFIGGVSLVHLVVTLLLVGSVPAFVVGAANLMYIHDRPSAAASGLFRLFVAWFGFPAMVTVLLWDPFHLGVWWID